MAGTAWIDLLDPDEEELRKHVPDDIRPDALQELLRPASSEGDIRPSVKSHGKYILGLALVAVALPEEDRVFYQEVDFVLTRERIVTVRKTPANGEPFDPSRVRELCDVHRRRGAAGDDRAIYLVDEIAERYLDLLDDIDEEIDELEEHVDEWPPEKTRRRISAASGTTCSTSEGRSRRREMRCARSWTAGSTSRVGRRFRAKCSQRRSSASSQPPTTSCFGPQRRSSTPASCSPPSVTTSRRGSRSTRTKSMKRLTAIASILLVPTFIVGVYGQNFDHMPELHWRLRLRVLVAARSSSSTVFQVVFYRRKGWI